MKHHVVRKGESLSGIARHYGIAWQELAQRNGIHNPDRLQTGQLLVVPDKHSAASSAHFAPWKRPESPRLSAPSNAVAAAATSDVTDAQLRAIMPTAGTRVARFLAPLNTALRTHEINTAERRAAFLAQISVESGELHHVEENLNYSAGRLRAVWPRRFHTHQTAEAYAHNPEALGNHVYADRLGNGDEPSGDGYCYRGRGLTQTTGRDNYRAAGFESNPDALSDPQTAADSAGRFWLSHGLNGRASSVLSRSQFDGVSRIVNGGNHGSSGKWSAYQRALRALQPADAP